MSSRSALRSPQETADQEGPRDVQEFGCLLGGQLLALRHEGDRHAPAHRLDHPLKGMERGGREWDLAAVRTDKPCHLVLRLQLGQPLVQDAQLRLLVRVRRQDVVGRQRRPCHAGNHRPYMVYVQHTK